MRLLIGLLALLPVALLVGTLLRSRFTARAEARRSQAERREALLRERGDIEERKTIDQLERELDVARAKEAKKNS